MLRLSRLSLIFACIFLSILSCRKKQAEETGTQYVSHLNQHFAGLQSTPEGIIVQAGRDTVVLGKSGTMLHFYANSFKDAAGAIITSGSISIQLIEMYKPGEMIANRTSTTVDNMPLQSGGQVNITATLNGAKVFANVFGIGFKQPSSSEQQMELYFQSRNNTDAPVTWKIADTTLPGRVSKGTNKSDTVAINSSNGSQTRQYPIGGFYHTFDSCTNFDWINCDHPATNKWGSGVVYTVVHVVLLDPSFDDINTMVYFVFPSINCAESLTFYQKKTNAFGGYDPKPSFPIGEPYKVVVMAHKDGSYYYKETSGTITADMNVNIIPEPETLDNIRVRLSGI